MFMFDTGLGTSWRQTLPPPMLLTLSLVHSNMLLVYLIKISFGTWRSSPSLAIFSATLFLWACTARIGWSTWGMSTMGHGVPSVLLTLAAAGSRKAD